MVDRRDPRDRQGGQGAQGAQEAQDAQPAQPAQPGQPVRIRPRPRGPLVVEGACRLYDLEGAEIALGGRTRILLCRCGASRTRPFCDGAHNRTAFEAPDNPPGDGR